MKNKKEALKFSDRYKKVKFFEKQKVLRKISIAIDFSGCAVHQTLKLLQK